MPPSEACHNNYKKKGSKEKIHCWSSIKFFQQRRYYSSSEFKRTTLSKIILLCFVLELPCFVLEGEPLGFYLIEEQTNIMENCSSSLSLKSSGLSFCKWGTNSCALTIVWYTPSGNHAHTPTSQDLRHYYIPPTKNKSHRN